MSRLRADKLVNRVGSGAPQLTYGAELPVGYGLTGAGGINITGIISTGQFVGNLTGTATTATTASTATTATNLADAANITTGTISADRLDGTYNIDINGIASTATSLETARTFEITGDIVASPISFDGTGNVSLAATIQPNSVALGSDTTGDYVANITGTSNQITVTSGTGEGSAPTLSIPNQLTAPQDVTVTRDLQVNRDLNVNGNITIGGTSATLFTTELKIFDPDIVLGFRTDANDNDVSNDNTANHGGVAVASTEGDPLVQLFIAGIETNPATYKKIMWFKSGTFAGLGTDAWLSNYAVGIGSTQFPTGTRLATGAVQFTESDLAVIENINASGIVTASGGFNIGIQSGGLDVTTGVVTALNFIGAGNTFLYNSSTKTVDISISGGGGSLSISTSVSSTAQDIGFVGGAATSIIGIASEGSRFVYLPSNGSVGVGTSIPTSKLHVVGDVLISGIITCTDINSTSDISLKTNIHPIENSLNIISNIRGVSFDWKESGKPSYGVIAQELEEVLPELVNGTDPKSVNYNGIIGILIEGIKSQQNQINELKAEVELLKNK